MASATLDSPTIFEKMLGGFTTFGPAPPKPKDDTSHRFYVCEKKEGARVTITCQRGTLAEVAAEATRRRQKQLVPRMLTGIHVVDVGAGCPAWNDQLVLAQKLRCPVSMGQPLNAGSNPPSK